MDNTTNALNWFEIPVTDMARAKHFYQVAFGIHLEDMIMEGMEDVGPPATPGAAAGAGGGATAPRR